MDDVQTTPRVRRGWFGRGRTRALLSVGLLLGMGTVATSAYFSDQVTITGVDIKSGTMHIDLGTSPAGTRPESIGWPGPALTNLAAGDSKSVILPVKNNSLGGVTFSYRVQAAATNTTGNLAASLQMTVRRGGTSNGTTCAGGTLIGTADATLNGFNQPAGANLAPTQSHNLCIAIKRATPSPGVTAGSQAAITLTFPATQVP